MTKEEAIQILSTRDWSGMLCGYISGHSEALDMAIEALKIDVVRCNDCRFFSNDKYEECHYYIAHGIRRKPNDFCSYGKHKGGGDE